MSQPTTTINITPRLTRQFKKRSKGMYISDEMTLIMDPTFYPQCLAPSSDDSSKLIPDAKKIHDSPLLSIVRNVFPKIHFDENVLPFSVQWEREREREFEETIAGSSSQQNGTEFVAKKTFSSTEQHLQKTFIQKYLFMRMEAKKIIVMYISKDLDAFAELLLTEMKRNGIEILFLCVESLEKEMHKLHKKIYDKAVKEKRRVEELVMPLQEKDIKSFLFRLQLQAREEHSLMLIVQYARHEKDTGQFLLNVTKSVAMEDYFDPRQELDVTNLQSKKTVGGKADHLHDAWYCFLMEIPKVKKNHAQTIVKKYSSLNKLAEIYFDPTIDEETKEDLLSNLQMSRGRVGPRVSSAVYEYFTRGQVKDSANGGTATNTAKASVSTKPTSAKRSSVLSSNTDADIETLAARSETTRKKKRKRQSSESKSSSTKSTTSNSIKSSKKRRKSSSAKSTDSSDSKSSKKKKSTSKPKRAIISDAMLDSSDDEIIVLR